MSFESNLLRAQGQEGVGQNCCDYSIIYCIIYVIYYIYILYYLSLDKRPNTIQLGEKNQ